MSRIEPRQQLTQDFTWNGFFIPAPYSYNMPWWRWDELSSVAIIHAYLVDTHTRAECRITEHGTRILAVVPVNREIILEILEKNLTYVGTHPWFKKFIVWRERNAHPE